MVDSPFDSEALALLDAYLAQLQAGEKPDRDALLRNRPELASAVKCLDALEVLAPPPEGFPDEQASSHCVGGLGGDAENGRDLTEEQAGFPRDFGPDVLIREIGRGGMGVVYEARQKGLDRAVAVKMILAGHLASPDLVRRFQSEAKAAARLRHSNIVHIHDVGRHQGQDFFAMEYIEGPSLAERIARGRLDLDAAVRLTAAVARAVDHLHRQGIIHRDLKPSNILLDPDGRPYVTDFGLAKVFAAGADGTATGVIAGTPSYMAPEQASGRRTQLGPAADVYSLGAILYELLTGRPPFQAESPLDTLMLVLGGDPELPRKLNARIPRGLELICLKCLAKDPAERYASAEALADDLDRFARGEVPEVRPPSWPQRFWSWTRRQPALASRFGALGLFYAIETVNYLTGVGGVSWDFHCKISAVIGLWLFASIVCQRLLDSGRWWFHACFAWGALDSAALLAVLLLGNGAASSLLVGYPLLIVGSALWFRVRFVWFMTFLSMLSYGVLMIDFYGRRHDLLQQYLDVTPDRHVIFLAALVVLGALVSSLVRRVRILSEFYGRPLY